MPPDEPDEGDRKDEREQRAAHRQEDERGAGVADQHVLEHSWAPEKRLGLGDAVEGRDERENDHGQPQREERCAADAGAVCPAAAPEPQEPTAESRWSTRVPRTRRRPGGRSRQWFRGGGRSTLRRVARSIPWSPAR